MKVIDNAKAVAGKVKLGAIKNGPTIGMVVGLGLVSVGVVLACKATLKTPDILSNRKEDLGKIEEAKEAVENSETSMEYSDDEQKRDILVVNYNCALNIAKVYAPAGICLGLGYASIIASFKTLKARNVILAAGFMDASRRLTDLQQKIIEEEGIGKYRHYMYGTEEKTVTTSEVDENGKKVKRVLNVVPEEGQIKVLSKFAKVFDEKSGYFTKDKYYNLTFLNEREIYCNTLLRTQGFLFLNDAYKSVGIAPTIAGQYYGWVWTDEDKELFNVNKGYRKVDFGIFDYIDRCGDSAHYDDWKDGILLDFSNLEDVLTSDAGRAKLAKF